MPFWTLNRLKAHTGILNRWFQRFQEWFWAQKSWIQNIFVYVYYFTFTSCLSPRSSNWLTWHLTSFYLISSAIGLSNWRAEGEKCLSLTKFLVRERCEPGLQCNVAIFYYTITFFKAMVIGNSIGNLYWFIFLNQIIPWKVCWIKIMFHLA